MMKSSKDEICADRSYLENDAISVEEVSINDFPNIDASWRDLYFNTTEANPCYTPDYVAKIYEFTRFKRDAKILIIRHSPIKGDEKLIGLLPIGFDFCLFNNHASIFIAQHSCYNGSSLPLIRTGFEKVALTALLDWLRLKVGTNGLFIFNEISLHGPIGNSLTDLLSERQQPWECGKVFERPLVDINSVNNFEDYLSLLKRRTRQTLKRKMRQLSRLGKITHTYHTGSELPSAMKEFTELEVKGWKGRAGTALLQSKQGANLALDTLASPSFGQTRIECLRLNGKAIAMNIYIGLKNTTLLFKPTYNEEYSKVSPGALLHLESIRQLYKERWTERLDSAVSPTDQLGSIWRQRQVVGSLIFGLSHLTPKASVSLAKFVFNFKDKTQEFFIEK